MIVGGVRTASQTFAAPPVARSWAISMPEQPGPTTNTRLDLKRSALRYSADWISSPEKLSRPSQSGTSGSFS